LKPKDTPKGRFEGGGKRALPEKNPFLEKVKCKGKRGRCLGGEKKKRGMSQLQKRGRREAEEKKKGAPCSAPQEEGITRPEEHPCWILRRKKKKQNDMGREKKRRSGDEKGVPRSGRRCRAKKGEKTREKKIDALKKRELHFTRKEESLPVGGGGTKRKGKRGGPPV